MGRYDGWFRLAHELRVPVEECMETHTERQMLLRHAWERENLDAPDRHDFYLMQVAAEVRVLREQVSCMLGGKPRDVKMGDFKLSFREPEPLNQERATEVSKQVWVSKVGGRMPAVVKKMSRKEAAEMVEKTREEWQDYARRNGT